MEPAEYAAYRNAPAGLRGFYAFSPQYSLDLGSVPADPARGLEYLQDVVTSPEYWVAVGLNLGGVAIARMPKATPEPILTTGGRTLEEAANEARRPLAGPTSNFQKYLEAERDIQAGGKLVGESPVLFKNLSPSDHLQTPSTQTVENIMRTGQSGRFNYVVTEDGALVLGRNGRGQPNGHIDLARGQDVLAAGEARFVNGELKYIDNSSGHYQPSGDSARRAALSAFEKTGVSPRDGYIERTFP